MNHLFWQKVNLETMNFIIIFMTSICLFFPFRVIVIWFYRELVSFTALRFFGWMHARIDFNYWIIFSEVHAPVTNWNSEREANVDLKQ